MSGFSKDWLDLREPSDHEARAQSLVDRVVDYLNDGEKPKTILDIGCGTGSTYRALATILPPRTRWRLLDHATVLLDEAKRRTGAGETVTFHCADLNAVDAALLDDVHLVTASALFDLCSADFCDRLAEKLVGSGIGLYAALNYDGRIEWTIPHPLDAQVVADFNRHQRSDKGFGQALGPDACAYLCERLTASGYAVVTAASPWRLGPQDFALQREFIAGFRTPLQEVGDIAEAQVKEWLAFRQSQIRAEGSLCSVGHTDLLALPRL